MEHASKSCPCCYNDNSCYNNEQEQQQQQTTISYQQCVPLNSASTKMFSIGRHCRRQSSREVGNAPGSDQTDSSKDPPTQFGLLLLGLFNQHVASPEMRNVKKW